MDMSGNRIEKSDCKEKVKAHRKEETKIIEDVDRTAEIFSKQKKTQLVKLLHLYYCKFGPNTSVRLEKSQRVRSVKWKSEFSMIIN
jgi:hypothetical protein